jgi:hypothetical protein
MQNKQEMPKWFDATVYSSGATVSNPFTGESVELTAEELSMYDVIMGAQMLQQYDVMQKGLGWFRRENAEAYMILLD